MFKYDKYITNSLIITKYINKTYQHKHKCLLLTARFPKGDNLNTNQTYPALTTILPILFLYLNTVTVTAGTFEP